MVFKALSLFFTIMIQGERKCGLEIRYTALCRMRDIRLSENLPIICKNKEEKRIE